MPGYLMTVRGPVAAPFHYAPRCRPTGRGVARDKVYYTGRPASPLYYWAEESATDLYYYPPCVQERMAKFAMISVFILFGAY